MPKIYVRGGDFHRHFHFADGRAVSVVAKIPSTSLRACPELVEGMTPSMVENIGTELSYLYGRSRVGRVGFGERGAGSGKLREARPADAGEPQRGIHVIEVSRDRRPFFDC